MCSNMAAPSGVLESSLKSWCCLVLMLVLCDRIYVTQGFNIEVTKPGIARGFPGSSFGYSVAIVNRTDNADPTVYVEKVLLVGAPNRTVMVKDLKVSGHGEIRTCNIDLVADVNITCEQLNTTEPDDICKSLKFDNNTCEMDMRMGSTIAVNRNYRANKDFPTVSLVTMCAPGWRNTYKERTMGQHHMYGMCVKAKTDLTMMRCRVAYLKNKFNPCWPFWPYVEHLNFHQAAAYHAFAQAGVSAAYTEEGRETIIGAPGVDLWRGAFMIGTDKYPEFPEPSKKRTTYLGYAVASGKFLYSSIDNAIGMPNYNSDNDGYFGRVMLFRRTRRMSIVMFGVSQIIKCDDVGHADMSVIDKKQVGSKFGAALATADLDGDGYDELLVGAPLYSGIYPDEGRVFVYTTSDASVCGPVGVLWGNAANRARFGTVIANAGDLNNDTIEDIAVGAPFEDGGIGAVYIYNGHGKRSEPMSNAYTQRIPGTFQGFELQSFGWSIYGNEDIDGNGYPDLAIGAYESDAVVMLRTRPVVDVNVTVKIKPVTIPLNASHLACSVDGIKLCTIVTVLFQYTSISVPSLTLRWKLIADTVHLYEEGYSRVYLRNSPDTSEANEDIVIESGNAVIRNYTLDVALYRGNPEPKDAWTKIRVEGWINLVNVSKQNHTELDPVFRETVQRHIVQNAEFDKKCQSLDKCTSDLQTDVKMFLRRSGTAQTVKPNTVLFVDNANELQVTIELTNNNNTAYRANFTATVQATIKGDIQTLHGDVGATCTHAVVRKSTEINCTADFRLGKNEKIKVTAFFDTSRPRLSPDKELQEMQRQLSVSVVGSQANKDEDLSNNEFHQTIPIKLKYDLSVDEDEFTSDQYRYQSKIDSTRKFPVEHRYYVINSGPSFSPKTIVNISVPIKKGSDVIAVITAVSEGCWRQGQQIDKTTPSTTPGTTTQRATIHSVDPEKRRRRDVTVTNAPLPLNSTAAPPIVIVPGEKNISCTMGSYECVMIFCKVRSLDRNEQETVSVKMDIPEKELAKEQDIRVIRYKTRAEVTDPYVWHGGKVVPLDLSVFAEKVTTFRVEPATLSTKIEIWIIIVSIIGAVILLAIVIGVLYKVGFFKRKKHTQVQQWKNESLYHRKSQMRMSSASNMRKSYAPLDGEKPEPPE